MDIKLAKEELKEIAKNKKPWDIINGHDRSRMMLEIIDGAIQVDPQIINGFSQTLDNGFDKYWKDWKDINAMIEIAKQQMSKNNIDH